MIKNVAWCPDIVIYLADELSGAFQMSDIMLDKDELPARVCFDISVDENDFAGLRDTAIDSVYQYLELQGITCPQCHKCTHDFRPLPECKTICAEGNPIGFRMDVLCSRDIPVSSFDLFLYPDKS